MYHIAGCGGKAGEGAAGGRWDSLGDLTEAAFDLLSLKDSLGYKPTAEIGYRAPPSLSGLARIVFSRLY